MGDLDRLVSELMDDAKRDIYEVTPTEQTDDFYRTIVLRYENARATTHFLSKQEYATYQAFRSRMWRLNTRN